MTAVPTMNAVIWLRVSAEAKIPTAVIAAVSNSAPMYWAATTPKSGLPPSSRSNGTSRVAASAMATNRVLPRYLPSSSSCSWTGWLNATSRVP